MIYITEINRRQYGNSIVEAAKETPKLFIRNDGRQFKKTEWRLLTDVEERERAAKAARQCALHNGLQGVLATTRGLEEAATRARQTVWSLTGRGRRAEMNAETLEKLQASAHAVATLAAEMAIFVDRLAALEAEQAAVQEHGEETVQHEQSEANAEQTEN